jgi:DNA-binding CsgD family transcriptional regulator
MDRDRMNAASDLERLSSLIDFIYRGATEPELWPDIVADTCGWLGSPKGMLYTPLHGKEQGGYYFQHGLPDFFLELYKARYQAVDMWTQQVVERRLFVEGNVILGTDLVPHDTLVQSNWYRDCLRVGGIAHLLTSVVFSAPSSPADAPAADMPTAMSFYRGDADAAYAEDERSRLSLLLPNFSRSFGVMTRLRLADFRVASSLSALDRLSVALLLMSGAGEVLFVNRAASSLLGGTDALTLDRTASPHGQGKLVARLPAVNREIARALSAAKRIDDASHFSSAIKVPGRVPGHELLLQVSRLWPVASFDADGQLPEVIAFLTDARRPLQVAPDLLCSVYRLTPAEARVAVAATAAGSIAELAASLSLGSNTVKTQLKQVYAKTGVKGRAELMRLVLGLASG